MILAGTKFTGEAMAEALKTMKRSGLIRGYCTPKRAYSLMPLFHLGIEDAYCKNIFSSGISYPNYFIPEVYVAITLGDRNELMR